MKFIHLIYSFMVFYSCVFSLYAAENTFIIFTGTRMSHKTATLFTLAENKNWTEFHCRLLNHYSEPDIVNDKALSLLHLAAIDGQSAIVKILLTQGHNPRLSHTARVNGKEDIIATPFHYACKEGHLEVLKEIIAFDREIINSTACEFNNTPLHVAAWYNKSPIIPFLLTQGAKIEAKNSLGSNPFHSAIWQNHTESIKALLEKPTSATKNAVMARNNTDNSPLDLAMSKNHRKEEIENYLQTVLTPDDFRQYITDAMNKHIVVITAAQLFVNLISQNLPDKPLN